VTVGDATAAYGFQAARSWSADNFDHLAREHTRRQEKDQVLLPSPSIDQAIWSPPATFITFTVTVLGYVEAFTISHSRWVGPATIYDAFAVWLHAYRRWTGARAPAIGGLVGIAAVSSSLQHRL